MARMTNNQDLQMLLSCYLDGELTTDELAIVVDALENDLGAIAEFRSLQASRRAVRTLPMLSMPVDLMPGGHLGEELSAYLDGELTTMEIPAVMAHIETCADCRAELADLDRSRIAVRALPGIEPPAFLDAYRPVVAPNKRRVWPGAAVVGSIAAAAIAFTIGFAGSGTEPTAIDLGDLQSRHAAVASVPTAVQVSNP